MNKRQNIIQAAAHLFAEQGFEGTTTLQIANEAGVTEPLIYYHFKGKDELFSHILETSFKEYFSRLETLEKDTGTQFKKIEALLDFHFRFVEEMPDETYIAVSTCPAKLSDPEHICTKNVQHQRDRLKAYLTDCLKKGIKSGEFNQVPVYETVNLLIAIINGLLRQRGLRLEEKNGMRDVTVGFCRRSFICLGKTCQKLTETRNPELETNYTTRVKSRSDPFFSLGLNALSINKCQEQT